MRSTTIGFTEQNGLEKVVDGVPIGAIIPYAGSTAPFGTLICNGAAISRSAYPELFEAIGTTWGAGDGSTTFNIPDLRGYFLRGAGGAAAALGTAQEDAIRNITGRLGIRPLYTSSGAYININAFTGADNAGAFGVTSSMRQANTPDTGIVAIHNINGRYINYAQFNANAVVPTANENRPKNYAVNYIIVYE